MEDKAYAAYNERYLEERKKRQRLAVILFAGLIVVLGGIAVFLPMISSPPLRQPKPTENLAAQHRWQYYETVDDMTGKQIHSAGLSSTNQVNFTFPYEGIQRATLMVRQHPRHGNDVIVKIERGQIIFDYRGATMLARFDESNAVSFRITQSADYSTTSTFVSDFDDFLRRLRNARRLRIELPIYMQGNVQFEFDVEGLKWPND